MRGLASINILCTQKTEKKFIAWKETRVWQQETECRYVAR